MCYKVARTEKYNAICLLGLKEEFNMVAFAEYLLHYLLCAKA